MVVVEGAGIRENSLNLLNYLVFINLPTLLETLPRVVVNLWTNRPSSRPPRIVHSLPPAPTDAMHTLLAQLADELVPIFPQLAVRLHQGADLPAGVQDGGVVAAGKGVADLRQRMLGQLLGQRHRHLSRTGQRAGAALAQ